MPFFRSPILSEEPDFFNCFYWNYLLFVYKAKPPNQVVPDPEAFISFLSIACTVYYSRIIML